MKFNLGFLLLSSITILSGCFSGPPAPPGMPQQVPAEHVRLKGVIVEFLKDAESDPCNNCMALVKIDSVEGFGARAKALFSKDTLPVKFMYTLNPFKVDQSSEPSDSLPGLNINDIFRGDVETVRQNNGNFSFRIFWYVKIKH